MRTSSHLLLLLSSLSFPLFTSAEQVYSGFDPRAYEKRSATCKAVQREQGGAVVDIKLSYVDINPNGSRTLLMVHGWPSLWSSWSYQIQEFKADYHLIVPDLRGFGESGHPGGVKNSGTLFDIVGDLTCILEDAGVEKTVCVGHDWGSEVCYEAARSRPDIFEGVVGAVVPYTPSAGNYTPVSALTSVLPKLTYQLYFDQKTAQATEELNKDIRRSVRATLRTVDSPPPDDFLKSSDNYLDAWENYKEIPPVPFFDKNEEDYFVESYEKSGFENTLEFYTDDNRYLNWKYENAQGNFTIPQPVIAILPTQDPVADWAVASKLLKAADFLPNLTTKMLPGAHWVQLEYPELFNAEMRKWLEEHFPPTPIVAEKNVHVHEEL
ncbi:hypothetical protein D9758_006213 [Tetrapyrgos nigripes]|uniref:AB hydrolase-1 domain-containing protein n=1 Tax=Tetrapyrgos nigripes TaxID=182062 RepID=A0A8H5GB43_9AGAR|nr:hypothetical protein D9758_006213 [Tetrapyrgos nigripes]